MSQPTWPHRVPILHEGHKGPVWSVAFSPDGKLVASGSFDATIRIRDVYDSSQTDKILLGHTSSVNSVSYSPQGNMMVSGSDDNTLRLWDTNTGVAVGEAFKGHELSVFSVAFSPSADLIASGSYDRTIRLWDVRSGASIFNPFKGHLKAVTSVAFSLDGTSVVSGSSDKTIRIWDIEQGKTILGPLKGHSEFVRSVAFSPNGSHIASASLDQTLLLWDPRSGTAIGKPYEGHTKGVSSVAFSTNGILITSGSLDGTVRTWDIRTGHQVNDPLDRQPNAVWSVAVSLNGAHIASGLDDNSVTIWDVSGNTQNIKPDFSSIVGGANQKSEVDSNPEMVDQHMSTQEMFDLLLRHGCLHLVSEMDPKQDNAVQASGGGFGDIWRGELYNRTRVAIKVWREPVIEQCDYKSLKRATREIHLWSKMKHENVHQLMGVIMFKGQSLGMVSEWMENGNLHDYLRRNPDVDRHQLCVQITSGLIYIHDLNMVHGDIKALNVLISSSGIAKLTDFGLSTMSESSVAFSATTSQAGTIRWAAPELLSEEHPKSKRSDIYALGMTLLETFTGTLPYPQCKQDFHVMKLVDKGVLPNRPKDRLRDNSRGNQMWSLLVSCWSRDPNSRPSAEQVFESLSGICDEDF
ncbi:unnamed protein product [Rhizoctonia solani]|uniref:Protein kinase domain-containing protein n=1 Tax=Rhizoctonia solani TaxID=456999 RepID=A0A8H3B1P2_9AGAM|nr:unnamed protein product [Rhizoctonia solani]